MQPIKTEITDPSLVTKFKNRFLKHCLTHVEKLHPTSMYLIYDSIDDEKLVTPTILNKSAMLYIRENLFAEDQEEKRETILQAVNNSITLYESIFAECDKSISKSTVTENINYALIDDVIKPKEKHLFEKTLDSMFTDFAKQQSLITNNSQKNLKLETESGLTGKKYDSLVEAIKDHMLNADGDKNYIREMHSAVGAIITDAVMENIHSPITPEMVQKSSSVYATKLSNLTDLNVAFYEHLFRTTIMEKYTQLGGPSQQQIEKHGLVGDKYQSIIDDAEYFIDYGTHARNVSHDPTLASTDVRRYIEFSGQFLNKNKKTFSKNILSEVIAPITPDKIEKIVKDFGDNLIKSLYDPALSVSFDTRNSISENIPTLQKRLKDELIEKYTRIGGPSQEEISKNILRIDRGRY